MLASPSLGTIQFGIRDCESNTEVTKKNMQSRKSRHAFPVVHMRILVFCSVTIIYLPWFLWIGKPLPDPFTERNKTKGDYD